MSNSFKLEKGEEITDGMDISLCVINKKTKEINYAGANNSIYILKNNQDIGLRKLLEFKATRKPIGKSLVQTPFENQYFKLKKDDCIYLFSDGFPDQFGGEKGKKYKYNKFKKFIISLQNLPLPEQESAFRNEYLNWVGSKNEQLDDITVIGIKI